MKKSFFRIMPVAVLVLLLLSPSMALEGAKNGLMLWALVVLPTLLPFMICSNVIVALDAIHLLILPFQWFLQRVLLLSDAGSYVMVSGLLCGYPMGARNCSDFLDGAMITEKEARYLLAICNHPSPMFLLGYTAALLPAGTPAWLLLASIYLPVWPLSMAAKRAYGIWQPEPSVQVHKERRLSFDESLMDSFEVMVKIGGYIMLFSIAALYILRLPVNAPQAKAVLLGFVEITTGLKALSETMKGVFCGMWITAATAFGGCSGIFQTKSVLKNAGLSIRHYVVWKAVHSLLSAMVFILLAYFLRLPPAARLPHL